MPHIPPYDWARNEEAARLMVGEKQSGRYLPAKIRISSSRICRPQDFSRTILTKPV